MKKKKPTALAKRQIDMLMKEIERSSKNNREVAENWIKWFIGGGIGDIDLSTAYPTFTGNMLPQETGNDAVQQVPPDKEE